MFQNHHNLVQAIPWISLLNWQYVYDIYSQFHGNPS